VALGAIERPLQIRWRSERLTTTSTSRGPRVDIARCGRRGTDEPVCSNPMIRIAIQSEQLEQKKEGHRWPDRRTDITN
jgi:hypothetical protein